MSFAERADGEAVGGAYELVAVLDGFGEVLGDC